MDLERIDLDDLGVTPDHWTGINEAWILCPFHEDKHPSCTINVVSGLFHCFSCGASGTVEKIAKLTGGRVSKKIDNITQNVNKSFENWRFFLEDGLAFGDEYLQSRGVTDDQVERFRIHKNAMGIAFPLYDFEGDITGCLVRHKNQSVKPKYKLYGDCPSVYPSWNIADYQGGYLYVTEGIFGVLSADRAGLNAVATLSASIRHETAELLASYPICIVFDDDYAGYIGSTKLWCVNSGAKLFWGLESDKLSVNKWLEIADALKNPSIMNRLSISELADMSGDSDRFKEELKNWLKKYNE